MRILICGDIVGRSGREVIQHHIPKLRDSLNLDLVIVNAENAAHGFGLTRGICTGLFEKGIDVLTSGNHIWDQREIISYIAQEPRLIRPLNFPKDTPGKGTVILSTSQGHKVLIINIMGRLYMDPLDDPFASVKEVIDQTKLGKDVQAIILDVHGEASSEKQAMAYYLDGRVSAVVGTHTHVPTADARILPKGTAYQTDLGMCGDYNSIIGMDPKAPLERFTKKMSGDRLQPAVGEGTLCGVFIETENSTGLAKEIYPVRIGPHLMNTH